MISGDGCSRGPGAFVEGSPHRRSPPRSRLRGLSRRLGVGGCLSTRSVTVLAEVVTEHRPVRIRAQHPAASRQVAVALLGAPLIANLGWRETVVLFGIPAVIIALGILFFVHETGHDQAAAVAHGSVLQAFGTILRDPDHRWIYLASVLGGGGRGLGIVNLFALLYLGQVLGVPPATTGVMYGALIVLSVPMPLLAGWLSDHLGRKPVIIGAYVGGAVGSCCSCSSGRASPASGRHPRHGPVQLRREPATPGPARRHRAADDPRRVVRSLLHPGVRVGSLWTGLYSAIIAAAGSRSDCPSCSG